jgi:hypothetical protein
VHDCVRSYRRRQWKIFCIVGGVASEILESLPGKAKPFRNVLRPSRKALEMDSGLPGKACSAREL